MKHLLVSKPLVGVVLLLLIVQMACVASSISPTAGPGTPGAGSANSTQAGGTQPSTGSQTTSQPSVGGGSQNTQSAPAPATGGGSASTQAAPTSSGQATQGVPSTGGQVTQAMPTTSNGGSAGAPATAQAMLSQVAQHYQSAGRQQALKDFTDKNPPFNNPDMFVMCLGADHAITAMGGFPLLVGVSADSLNEVTGQSMGNLIWDAANLQPQGSVQFRWKNPLNNAVEAKTLYYQKLSQDVCGVVANSP